MPPPHILYLALKSILVNRLQKILYCSEKACQSEALTDVIHSAACASDEYSSDPVFLAHQLNLNDISLRRVQRDDQTWYVSATAFKLAKFRQMPALQLALEIADALNRDLASTNATIHPSHLDRVWRSFTVQPIAPGWIHLKLSAIGLHEWLNCLSNWLPALLQQNQRQAATPDSIDSAIVASSTSTFPVLYSHARCCSLLRLGVKAELIQLAQPDLTSATWTLTAPKTISWLNADRQFRCTHASEQRLITQIVDILDELDCLDIPLPPKRLWQLAHRLSQAFQDFYAHCRILGAIQTDDRDLAQARLGLILITQALLCWILRDRLHIAPPIEL